MLFQFELLGVKCHSFTINSLNDLILQKIKFGDQVIIANHNLHSVYLFHNNKEFKEFFKLAEFVHIDGMPLVYWSKIIGHKINRINRITYVDWVYPLMDIANRNRFKIYYLGGRPGVAKSAISFLEGKYRDVVFKEHNGYFDVSNKKENNSILEDIKGFKPHILMVGMSMPRQEIWIKKNLAQLPNCVILPCGACFDYLAGEVKTPPRILGAIGLEWLYRFMQEPRRLFSRYFIEPIFLLPLLIKDLRAKVFK